MVWLPDDEESQDTITCFDRIHERDEQTDRQMNRHNMTA